MKLLETKAAALLCMIDLGAEREYRIQTTYKYAGKEKAKTLILKSPTAMNVRSAGTGANISIWAKIEGGPYNSSKWNGVRWNDSVEIWVPEE